jgi:hypothetical protein
MKYTLYTLFLLFFVTGCGSTSMPPKEESDATLPTTTVTTAEEQVDSIVDTDTDVDANTSTPPLPTQEYSTYSNDEIGISFQYQTGIGEPQENRYKEQELLGVSFVNKSDASVPFGLSPSEYPSLRTCADYLTNGFYDGDLKPQNCSSLRVDNRDIVILTFTQGKTNGPSKQIHLQTKKGVWNLSTENTALYTELEKIAQTIQFTE